MPCTRLTQVKGPSRILVRHPLLPDVSTEVAQIDPLYYDKFVKKRFFFLCMICELDTIFQLTCYLEGILNASDSVVRIMIFSGVQVWIGAGLKNVSMITSFDN